MRMAGISCLKGIPFLCLNTAAIIHVFFLFILFPFSRGFKTYIASKYTPLTKDICILIAIKEIDKTLKAL